MSTLYAVLGFVLLQRAAELGFAATNTRHLRAQGAVETDARGYPWFVLLHGAWLASLLLLVPADAAPSWPLLAVFAALQLVEGGPYRYLRHPNYAIVAGEIAVLPLAFGAIAIALIFSVANLALTARRIGIENRALAAWRPAFMSSGQPRSAD